MTSVLSNLSGSIGGVVGGTEHWVAEQWTQRVVQISVYASIVFFVLSSYPLIAFVEKHVWNVFGVKLGKEGTLALHSVIFGLFMYVGTRFILDPMLGKVVEGSGGFDKLVQDAEEEVVEEVDEEVGEKVDMDMEFLRSYGEEPDPEPDCETKCEDECKSKCTLV